MDHLNIFNPYENKPLHHEDQLTRALMILVKNSRAVELAFTDLIIDRMVAAGCKLIPKRITEGIAGLESVRTQVWSSTGNELTSAAGRLVSVLITDKKLEPAHRVERSGRVAVYDAIIRYKPDWLFVVENKPDHRNVWAEQMSAAFSASFEVEPQPVLLTWQDVITRISAVKENGVLQGADACLAEDFLDFVADRFPELNPYNRFGLCKDHQYLLDRRCVSVMEESQLGPVGYRRGWHSYIRLPEESARDIALYPEARGEGEWEIRLALYPGATMSQARHFYSHVKPEEVLGLSDAGWQVRPRFQLASRASTLLYTSVSCSLREYLEYWIRQVKAGALWQGKRRNWDALFKTLAGAGMLSDQDDAQIRERIINTRMEVINVCPEVEFIFRWSKGEAVDLDDKGTFLSSFRKRVEECVQTWR